MENREEIEALIVTNITLFKIALDSEFIMEILRTNPTGSRDFTRSVTNIFKQAGLQYSNEMIQRRFRSFNQGNY